tara:strand:- start:1120 stop:2175 length:1056 start_codon:yes stop_codon:yes gene_type:complete
MLVYYSALQRQKAVAEGKGKEWDEKFKRDTDAYNLLKLKYQAEHPRWDQKFASGAADFGTGLWDTAWDIATAPVNLADSVVHVGAAGVAEMIGDHHAGAALMKHAGASMVKVSDGLGVVPFVGTAVDLAVAGVAEASGDHSLAQRKLGDAAADAIADVVTVATGGVGGVAMKVGKVATKVAVKTAGKAAGKVAIKTAQKTAVHESVAAVEKTTVKSAQHAIISAPKIVEKTAAKAVVEKAVVKKAAEKAVVKESMAKGAVKSLAKGTVNRAVLNAAFDSILPAEEPLVDTVDSGGTTNEATISYSSNYIPVLVGLGVGFIVSGGVVKKVAFGGAAATGTAWVLYRQSLISY